MPPHVAMFSRSFLPASGPPRTVLLKPLHIPRSQRQPLSSQCLFQTPKPTRLKLPNGTRIRLESTFSKPPSKPSLFSRLWTKYQLIVKATMKDAPIMFPIAIVSGIGISGLTLWVLYLKFTNDPAASFAKYPPPVGNELLVAAYYTRPEHLNPPLAMKHYREALIEADKCGMDPFSDEVLGIKLHLVLMFENAGWIDRACEVLETVRGECGEWVARGRFEAEARRKKAVSGEGTYNVLEEDRLEEERMRVSYKMVNIAVKLSELYAGEYIQDDAKAEQSLNWALELSLKEVRRRERAGKDKFGSDWFDKEKLGLLMEEAGSYFEKKDRHALAAPLYLNSLALIAEQEAEAGEGPSCKQVVLMNNLSISLAQQLPHVESGTPPPSRAAMVQSARQWAAKSLDVAATIKPPRRTDECDIGCAVATHSLGEFAEMEGNVHEARKKYEEASSLAKAMGFTDGIANADEGIRRLIERKTLYDAE